MMSQEQLTELLRKLPAVQLDLLELTRKAVGENGALDAQKIAFHYQEIGSAIAQAESYARATKGMVQCLLKLGQ
jgi:hypothetical protein